MITTPYRHTKAYKDEIEKAIQKLEEDRAHHWGWDGVALRLGVVMDNLEKIVFRVFEDHEDAFAFENDFDEMD